MKVAELMIGDWIFYGDKSVKVLQLSENSKYDWAKPIPLTPEILEKNGFCFVKSSDKDTVWNGWWIYKDLELGTCCLDRNANWPCCINITDLNIPCEYVHQLQYALCLCGLNEIADNFKI